MLSYKRSLYFLVASVAVAVLPAISGLIAYAAAGVLGCTVSEASVNPCRLLGIDIGGALNAMVVMIWSILITVPIGVIGVLIGFVWTVYVFIRNRRHPL